MTSGIETVEALHARIEKLEHELTLAKKANCNLKLHQDLFATMQHEVHMWELVYNADNSIKTWRLITANPITLKSWGMRLEDIQGKLANDIFNTNATEQFMPIVSKIFAERKAYSWESFFPATGQHLGMTSIPFEGYFISIGVDITDIKERELLLKDTLVKLQEVITASNIGLWSWDLETNETHFSPEWKAQLGYEDHELDNTFEQWVTRLHPEDSEHALAIVDKTLQSGGDYYESKFRMAHKDGSYRWIMAHGSLLRDEEGVLRRLVGTHADITNQVKMEQALLRQQKVQTLGTFAGGIAHDFNNLLTPILGYTQLLELALQGQDAPLGYARELEKTALRAKDLVQQILLVSNTTASSSNDFEPTLLQDLIAEITTQLSTTSRVNVDISLDCEPQLPAINANATQVHRAIMNIMTNAIHAMPHGGKLTVTLQRNRVLLGTGDDASLNHCLTLKIADNGIGMDSKTLAHIFDPFYSTKKKSEQRGTGLGLAIVANVMEQHHGKVDVHSKVGEGSCFSLHFPLVEGTQSVTKVTPSLHKNDAIKYILFVDDELALCELGQNMLTEIGYCTQALQSANDALVHLKANPTKYQLIFTDYAMPEMDGIEFIRNLRKNNIDIPVVITTGFTNMVSAQNQQKWQCQGILAKPYSLTALSEVIANVAIDSGLADESQPAK
ncbi:hybrid sensor histidine kinase/response regulator [Pseudoalteromonas sp. SSDWG2]|uniref:hybrid sensor histidine kinase/response regulator n=1 Tax=Pseudoalteromonas sp. SSDWG2 TaxID=3139391 RepID=UPI003BA8D03E